VGLEDVVAVQALLDGAPFPASKAQLLAYAAYNGAKPGERALLERLPNGRYACADDVGEALHGVQPHPPVPAGRPVPSS
jgi:hypothetical protein